MAKPEFTDADLDTILDALDEMERKDAEFLPGIEKLLKILPEPRCEEHHRAYAEFRQDMLKQESKLKKEKKIRREKITLLKAKIIVLQQDRAIERLGEPDEDENSQASKENREHQ